MNNSLTQPLPPTPPGLQALYETCNKVYPDQSNPLQVTALVKFWLGGPDPLDYISMYSNSGNPSLNVPPHWHYVSFGLSDLHGDGRVHEVGTRSGFGFEMTFRLKREEGETAPPTWPAKLLQTLARYIFQSGNTLCAGDYASWHIALDNSGDSAIRHMLMAADPQLCTTQTPHGEVQFVQIVGVCAEEVKAAQQWSVPGVLNILKHLRGVGGHWLVTDMRRTKTMQELEPLCQSEIDRGIHLEGSNLSCVSTRYLKTGPIVLNESGEVLSGRNGGNSESMYSSSINSNPVKIPSTFDQRCSGMQMGGGLECPSDLNANSLHVYDSLHLSLDSEAGSLLSLALRGRVLHGRHFTFNAILDDQVVTLVAPSVTGTFVDQKTPYARHGPWTHLLVPLEFASEMTASLEVLTSPEMTLPRTFHWADRKLAITIESDKYVDSLKPMS